MDADDIVSLAQILSMPRPVASHFVAESNRIEGIHRDPTQAEIQEFERFMALREITIQEIERFVSVSQSGAVLRDKTDLNAFVGGRKAPVGGPHIRQILSDILDAMDDAGAYQTHIAFELLHPFTDCNGRAGRMIWAWQMRGDFPLGFLLHFYYQSLYAQATK